MSVAHTNLTPVVDVGQMLESDSYSGPGSVYELKKKYHAVFDEKQQLETQLQAYRKRERCVRKDDDDSERLTSGGELVLTVLYCSVHRQFLVHSKLVGDSTRRVSQLSR